jgi:type IV pilus assembly protein PilO
VEFSWQKLPWAVRGALGLAFGGILIAAGLYLPGSPVRARRIALAQSVARLQTTQAEVDRLRFNDRLQAQLQVRLAGLRLQLVDLQSIVPEDKQASEFILMVQGAAFSSNVSIRRLTARPTVAHEYYYEMPFEVEVDGPYYGVEEFFGKLSALPRIVNVGDVTITAFGEEAAKAHHSAPSASITSIFTLSAFFTAAPPVASAGKP